VIHKSCLLNGTEWSKNPACYMEHKAIHKSSLLHGTQTVIHKPSLLHGAQSDPQLHGTQSGPQIQSITLNTKRSTNPVCHMEHKQWSTNPVCHMAHSDPQIQPITWNTKWSTNPVCYMEHKCSNHISGQWQWCTNIFLIPSGAIHRYQGILTPPPPFPLVCPAPCPCQSNPYINVFFSCSWYMHPVAGSTLLMKHVLIFTIPQTVTL
jgi:hypothetical protein